MHTCPVCGYPELDEPPRSTSGGGSYEICPSCGFQFGLDDDDGGIGYATSRERWIAAGMPWSSRSRERPSTWNPAVPEASASRALAEQLHRDQVLATRALATLMLNELPEGVRSRVHQAIHDGTGYVELRTRIETGEVKLWLMPTDGSEPLWLARF
jgi:hypothetical protein